MMTCFGDTWFYFDAWEFFGLAHFTFTMVVANWVKLGGYCTVYGLTFSSI